MSENPGYDARKGSGDIETDPAAMGEVSYADPDGDGGAVPGEHLPSDADRPGPA
ncbi:MAG: hypothetical protein M3P95_03640 [Actinomycetota bacterium]|jgi:hypothetical protein|nr:hypothetical protein [Actinomycetota bacterium]